MNRKLQGIAILLLSILLTIGFDSLGWDYVFDLSLQWQHIFLLVGVIGAAMVFWPDKRDS